VNRALLVVRPPFPPLPLLIIIAVIFRRTAIVALWAKSIHLKEPGVSLLSPPATLKYYKRKTKKSSPLDASPGAPGPPLGSSDLVASLVEACRATIGSNATNLKLVRSPPSSDAGSLEGDPPLLIEYLKFAGVLPTKK
ncbi:hypothetical protein PTTG_30435, partial [Puccinia triticina 1-1 BBBD Race 1]